MPKSPLFSKEGAGGDLNPPQSPFFSLLFQRRVGEDFSERKKSLFHLPLKRGETTF